AANDEIRSSEDSPIETLPPKAAAGTAGHIIYITNYIDHIRTIYEKETKKINDTLSSLELSSKPRKSSFFEKIDTETIHISYIIDYTDKDKKIIDSAVASFKFTLSNDATQDPKITFQTTLIPLIDTKIFG
ncbi:MAG: hypothetical protein JSS09_06910, partial [Verrucomicrobia bacterium]|nr:hypothetical protein [Verrucomicrobiota bacterium]